MLRAAVPAARSSSLTLSGKASCEMVDEVRVSQRSRGQCGSRAEGRRLVRLPFVGALFRTDDFWRKGAKKSSASETKEALSSSRSRLRRRSCWLRKPYRSGASAGSTGLSKMPKCSKKLTRLR